MITIIKSEWHQVEKRYAVEIDLDSIQRIYPDLDDDEAEERLQEIINGDYDLEEFVGDGCNELDFEWLDEDDWITDRKGGYEVTYDVIVNTTDEE